MILYYPTQAEEDLWNEKFQSDFLWGEKTYKYNPSWNQFHSCISSFKSPIRGFDIFGFENALKGNFGYKDDCSIKEFCLKTFGEDFTLLISKFIDGGYYPPELENPNPNKLPVGKGVYYERGQKGFHNWIERRSGTIVNLELGDEIIQFGISDPYRNPYGGGGNRLEYKYVITHLRTGMMVREFDTLAKAENYIKKDNHLHQFLTNPLFKKEYLI